MPDEKNKPSDNRDKVVVKKDGNETTKKDFENLDQALEWINKDRDGRKTGK